MHETLTQVVGSWCSPVFWPHFWVCLGSIRWEARRGDGRSCRAQPACLQEAPMR